MDVSAATGRSLTQVTTALSRAYAGNTTGLSRLGAGLDKNLLKAGNMDDIMAELNNKFSGQAAARLDTYAGKMDLLTVATANAQEIIGKGLLDALSQLGNDKSIVSVTNNMEDFATATSEVLVGLGKVVGKLKEITNIPGIDGSFLRNVPGIGAVLRATEALRGAGRQQTDRGGLERTAGRVNAQQRKQEERAIKNSIALRKTENDLLKKKTAVDQLKDKFDLERIGLTAALNAATDEETKLRLRSQLAILDNNEALAKKLLAEMDAAQGLKKFTDELIASTDKFSTMVNKLVSEFMTMGLGLQEASALAHMSARYEAAYQAFSGGSSRQVSVSPESYFQNLGTKLEGNANYAGMSAAEISMERLRESGNRPVNLTLTVDTANSGDRFSQLIAESIQLASRSGYGTTPAGSLP
jgi:phage shock protein A